MFKRRIPFKQIPRWKVPSISDEVLMPAYPLFHFYCKPMTIEERVEHYDALVRKEEEEWHRQQAEDWLMGNEMRSYRYGRQLWHKDEKKAHAAMDIHTPIPRGYFSSPF